MDAPRLDADQLREQAGHHQALDVVGVAVFERLPERLGHAAHVGVAGPVQRRQRLVGVECVVVEEGRHPQPVHAADELAPAQHLAHKAFHRRERRGGVVPSIDGGGDDAPRVEQLEIHRRADARVVEPRFAHPHRVLVVAEQRQPLRDEILQCRFGVLWRHRPVETRESAGMRGEVAFDEIDHLAGRRIRLEADGRGKEAWAAWVEGFAVVVVEVPLPPFGLVAVHQHVVLAAHLAIEVLHPVLLAALRPAREVLAAGEEMHVVARDPTHAGITAYGWQRLRQPPFAGCHRDDRFGFQPSEILGQRGLERRCLVRIELAVVHGEAPRPQRIPKMPHRGKEYCDTRLCRPHPCGLVCDFRHPHRIPCEIKAIEGCRIGVQLVAENDDKMAKARWHVNKMTATACTARSRSAYPRRRIARPAPAAYPPRPLQSRHE